MGEVHEGTILDGEIVCLCFDFADLWRGGSKEIMELSHKSTMPNSS